ncbi:HlyD family secretion protein [Flexibacter flexilis DSM 6793]|uniref:HlyD family secretion protein n=1 Tax=Flexibacter flexilis DSM 6793 TaxID=927664 RepID=A0A1I1INR8_9BACT|nr:HlyD family efflux transporter periplasmic adaptor subunit [Flexibacter flexilis]SFC37874.1 HlyD family secretion protein [Flexibacter flexilis DSM 6793]
MKNSILVTWAALVGLAACHRGQPKADASGNFEADEVIVAAQQNGQLLTYQITEGARLKAGAVVGQIDVAVPTLQREQTLASIAALKKKTNDVTPQIQVVKKQIVVLRSQLEHWQHEQKRTQALVQAQAATQKQLDDINDQIDQLQKQIEATQAQIDLYQTNVATQNRSVLSETAPLQKAAEQLEVQIQRGQITNPVAGTVLTNYTFRGEMAAIGKPLYKIANVDTLTLRAYITGDQLPLLRVGQPLQVHTDQADKTYTGKLTWVADKAEFTPKTIQTQTERQNLVYAIKVRVPNDGFLKIGMYGEIFLEKKK